MTMGKQQTDAPGSADYEFEPDVKPVALTIRGLLALLIVAVAVFMYSEAGGIYYGLKDWRSSSLVTKAEQALLAGDERTAYLNLQMAYLLLPERPQTLRSIARYHQQRREEVALYYLKQIAERTDPDVGDGVAMCREALRWGAVSEVRGWLEGLPEKYPTWNILPEVQAVRAELQALDGFSEEAVRNARDAVSRSRDGMRSEANVSLARVLLLAPEKRSADGRSQRKEAVDLLMEEGLNRGLSSRDALETMLQLAKQPMGVELMRGRDFVPLVASVEARAELTVQMKVDIWNLRLASAGVDERLAVLEAFHKSHSDVDAIDSLQAARWLLQKGDPGRAIAMARSKVFQGEGWFLVYVDACAARQDWDEVLRMLQSGTRPPIPIAVAQLFAYRARRALGQNPDAALMWRTVQAAVRSEKAQTQLYVATYAELLACPREASSIYRRLTLELSGATHSSLLERQQAFEGAVRTHPTDASITDLIEIYRRFVREFPQRKDALNDWYFLRSLSGEELAQEEFLRLVELLREQPELLARLTTLALATLRTGDATAADALYSGREIKWDSAPDRFKAVRVAVLEQAGRRKEAAALRANIDTSTLRLEEKELCGLD